MPAWIDARPVEVADAVAAAGQLLGRARAPLLAGLAADIDAIRVAHRLAVDLGAVIDADPSGSGSTELSVLASFGAMSTTLAEARARSDLVLVVGEGPQHSPLLSLLLDRPPSRAGVSHRNVVGVGGPAGPPILHHVAVAPDRLGEAVGTVRARLAKRMAFRHDDRLSPVAEQLAAARFAVVVYDPAELGDLGLEMLQGLVRDLNASNRCSSLALGREPVSRAALGYLTRAAAPGFRIGFGRGGAEHDPWRFQAERLLSSGECDATLWLAAAPADAPAWLKRQPAVAVVGGATGTEATIVVEVAVPGESAAGIIFDEALGTLRHAAARSPAELPGAAAVLAAIGKAALESREAAAC